MTRTQNFSEIHCWGVGIVGAIIINAATSGGSQDNVDLTINLTEPTAQ